jgi:hypothetical protein
MVRAGAVRAHVGIVVLVALLVLSFEAGAASCRGYPESVRAAIKTRIETLRLIEREAADRLLGLDTRTFPFLAGEARKMAEAIADARALKDEDSLRRCRNFVQPVRAICRGGAEMLAALLDAQDAGTVTKELKQAYAEPMGRCEWFMRLPPLKTAIRASD